MQLYTHTHTHTDSFNEIKNNKEKYKNKSYLSIKNNGGITLVALVVTIVILIILAGISIMGITQTGIFNKAKIAKEKYESAQEKENETLTDYDNKMNEIADISGSRDTVTINKEEYNSLVNGTFQKLRSNNYIDVAVSKNVTTKFVAPTDGYYTISTITGEASYIVGWVYHYNKDEKFIDSLNAGGIYTRSGGSIYMQKDEYVEIFVQTNVSIKSSKFWYAVGCSPEE